MLFNFSIQTKHFIRKKSKFFKKMNCFTKILYPNTPLGLPMIVEALIRCLRCSWRSSYRWVERFTFIFSIKFVFVGCIFYTPLLQSFHLLI